MTKTAQPRRVALARCSTLPDWEVDDLPLHRALEALGVECLQPSWDDPSFSWASCDLVIPRLTWDYQDRAEDFLLWLARVDKESQLLNPLPLIRWNIDKRYLRALSETGLIETPESVWFPKQPADAPLPELAQICAERGWRRAFLKPVIGATAQGTLRFDADQPEGLEAARAHLTRWLPKRGMILQRYHEEVEREGEFSLIYFDGSFSHGVQKIPVSGDYRVQDDYGASDHPWSPPEDWQKRCLTLLQGLTVCPLYMRFDFLRGQAGEPRLIELELIEPSLFFRHDDAAAGRLAASILRRIEAGPAPWPAGQGVIRGGGDGG